MTVKVLDEAGFKVAATTTGVRVLDFYAATFNSMPDKNGDTIDAHAFDAWLQAFYKIGKPLPISFAHAAVLDSVNPFAIIGSASADPEHVWTDDFGLRVKANIDVGTNDTAKQVASLIDQGIITGASIAFTVTREEADQANKGAQRIMEMQVKEAGPCLSPANESAVVLALKQVRDELLHVEPEATDVVEDGEPTATEHVDLAIKHAQSPAHLQAAHDALVRAGAKCASTGEVAKTVESHERDVQDRLRNLRWMEKGLL
jgi:HK97 family phage prohead protease